MTRADSVRSGVGQVVLRLPETAAMARSGAQNTVTRLQTLSDSRLGLLAAASIGLGTGLRLAGAPRLATLAGFAPASILGFAIASRPIPPRPAPSAARP